MLFQIGDLNGYGISPLASQIKSATGTRCAFNIALPPIWTTANRYPR